MFFLAEDQIVVSEGRFRSEVKDGPLKELSESILARGLLHPIVVQEIPVSEPSSPVRYSLVAGFRRFTAMKKLYADAKQFSCNNSYVQLGYFPCTLLSEQSALGAKEAELEENIKREDLTWQDRARALSELHNLRKTANPEQTITATAREVSAAVVGQSVEGARYEVARAVMLAPHLSKPEVAGARSIKEAFAIVSRAEQAEFKSKLAEKIGPRDSKHKLIEGDLCEQLVHAPANYFDFIIADPPYGMDADKFAEQSPGHRYDDSPEEAVRLADTILKLGFVVTKPRAHLYMFCDVEHFLDLRALAEDYGWYAFRTPLIWFKGLSAGHVPIQKLGIRRTYELILFCVKGDKPINSIVPDVIEVPRVQDRTSHGAEKPVNLYTQLLSRSAKPGDAVLDPCCGTGTVFEAANELTLEAWGIEQDAASCKLAAGRMTDGEL